MRVTILLLCMILFSSLPCLCAQKIPGTNNQSTLQSATGYFGGVVKNRVRLILSTQGGILMSRISLPLAVKYKTKIINITDLPPNTPVRVTTDDGRVVSVEVMEDSNI